MVWGTYSIKSSWNSWELLRNQELANFECGHIICMFSTKTIQRIALLALLSVSLQPTAVLGTPARTTFGSVSLWDGEIVNAIRSGREDEAAALLDKASANLDLKQNISGMQTVGDIIVHRYLELADFSKSSVKAIWALKRAAAVSRVAGQRPESIASVLRELASALLFQKQFTEAAKVYEQSIEVGVKAGDHRIQSDGYRELSNISRLQKDYKKQAEFSKKANELFNRSDSGSRDYLGQQVAVQGDTEVLAGNIDAAIKSYTQALNTLPLPDLKCSEKIDCARRIETLFSRGDAFVFKGELASALADYKAGMVLMPILRDGISTFGINHARLLATIISCDQNQPKEAENLFQEDRKSKITMPQALLLARIYNQLKKPSLAESTLTSAMASSNHSSSYALAVRQVAYLMVQQGNLTKACTLLEGYVWEDGAKHVQYLPEPDENNWGDRDLKLMIYLSAYAIVLEKKKDHKAAAQMNQWFQTLAKRVFSKKQSYYDLPDVAEAFLSDGHPAEAESTLKKMIQLCSTPSSVSVRKELLLAARVYHQLLQKSGRQKEALSVAKVFCQAEATHQL
ncbi:MAG: hypothetical protein K2Z81_00535 [Cyanobacteria bacterium]|nr:hypothetical protein [Cyanobacteriota bacterium]